MNFDWYYSVKQWLTLISGQGYKIAKLVGNSSSNLLTTGLTTVAGAFSKDAAKAVSQALLIASGRIVSGQ